MVVGMSWVEDGVVIGGGVKRDDNWLIGDEMDEF